MATRPQIIATLGPSSYDSATIEKMVDAGMSAARLNLTWGPTEERLHFKTIVREIAVRRQICIPLIYDLSGPREQDIAGHHFNGTEGPILTQKDRNDIALGISHGVDYFALSYVGSSHDVAELRAILDAAQCDAKIISKIERKEAVDDIEAILKVSDAIMVARGDLGNAVPLSQIPFYEIELITKARLQHKPVIVATDMMPSMITNEKPTRSDVTDVAFAAMSGADVVMLSNETTAGKYPVETVAMMASILDEAVARGFCNDIHPL